MKLLSTGDERPIPRPVGVPANAYWVAESWFPDSTQLLADAWGLGGGYLSMWTVSVLGESPRKLREGGLGAAVSPDGTHIVSGLGLSHEIEIMGSKGDNPQKVLALGENEWIWINSVRWSPDGRRLAYCKARRDAQTYKFTAIESCDLEGANRTVVVPDADLNLGEFCWLPDGRIVYPRQESPQSGDANLWQIGIDGRTGAPVGKPKRISQWAGSLCWNLSASADGKRLAFLKTTGQAQVYLGELAAGGTRLSPPRRLRNQETHDRPTGWTADSKAILFDSSSNGEFSVFKQGIGQDKAQLLVAEPQRAVFPAWPRLSADGAWIIYAEIPKTASTPVRLMRIPVSGGVPQLVLETTKGLNAECARAPASLCVLLEERRDEKHFMVTAFDPLKGKGKVLRTIEKDPFPPAGSTLSPDGSTFAISRSLEGDIRIRLLSLSGGSDREITLKGWADLSWMGLIIIGSPWRKSKRSSTDINVDCAGQQRINWLGSLPLSWTIARLDDGLAFFRRRQHSFTWNPISLTISCQTGRVANSARIPGNKVVRNSSCFVS